MTDLAGELVDVDKLPVNPIGPVLRENPTGTCGVAQVVEQLPIKCEKLSPNPSTAKEEKKKIQLNLDTHENCEEISEINTHHSGRWSVKA
jgi:hypothetical protein